MDRITIHGNVKAKNVAMKGNAGDTYGDTPSGMFRRLVDSIEQLRRSLPVATPEVTTLRSQAKEKAPDGRAMDDALDSLESRHSGEPAASAIHEVRQAIAVLRSHRKLRPEAG